MLRRRINQLEKLFLKKRGKNYGPILFFNSQAEYEEAKQGIPGNATVFVYKLVKNEVPIQDRTSKM